MAQRKNYVIPKWLSITLWVLVAISVIMPFSYFILHLSNPAFMSNTMGNWFATIIGAFAGVPIGFVIARLQIRQQEFHQEEDSKLRDARTLDVITRQLQDELRDNRSRLERYREVLNVSSSSTIHLFEWGSTISGSFSSSAFETLIQARRHLDIPVGIEQAVYISYNMLLGLRDRTREASAAHDFYLSHEGDTSKANREIDFIRHLSRETLRRVDHAIFEVKKYRLILSK